MIVVTGMQGSGKTTVSNILSQELDLVHEDMYSYFERALASTEKYRTYLYLLAERNIILEAALGDTFALELLQIKCPVILMRAPCDKKIKRLAKRNNTTEQDMKEKYSFEFKELQIIENCISPTYIIDNEDMNETIAQARSIAQHLLR